MDFLKQKIDLKHLLCYNISGDYMFSNIENLKIVNAFYGNSSLQKDFYNRQTHGFVFKVNGESLYKFKNKETILAENDILFIPQGENYSVKRLSNKESRYALINFTADLNNPSPKTYRLENFSDIAFIFDKLIKLWLFQNTPNHYRSLSLFYEILSYISMADQHNYCGIKKKSIIEPAIKYLEEHIFDINLKTKKLHTLCGVSDTYFRKIFISDYGVSPKQYITNKRLTQARNILNSGDYSYIYDVAESVGYTDPLYFSRIFKKHYGYFPSGQE